MSFSIEILEQGWIVEATNEYEPSKYDLCSHGRINLVIGGQQITSGAEDEGYGISTTALALLRTLASDHSLEHPVAERLILHGCCLILTLLKTCPVSINWSVEHEGDKVRISDVFRCDTSTSDDIHFPGLVVELPEAEYRRQVVQFALQARQLFENTPKQFHDDFDRDEYLAFWAEYNSLLNRFNHD